MGKKTFSIEEVQKQADLGLSIEKIAKLFNTSKPTMGRFMRENGIDTLRKKQNAKAALLDESEIAKKYEDGSSVKKLSEEYNVSNTVIKRILTEKQVRMRTNSEVHKIYHEDENYFNEIDTMNKAYLLGFICADGFVTDRNEIGICVKDSDIGVVEFFKNELQTDKSIVLKDNSVELRIQNIKLKESIVKYEILPRKSLTLNIENVITKACLSEDQVKAFLLGYFDGDGGIYKSNTNNIEQYSFSITGTNETCQYYKSYFNNIGFFNKRYKDDEKNNNTYQVGGRNQVRKCLEQLYEVKDQLDFYYERKYLLFTEC